MIFSSLYRSDLTKLLSWCILPDIVEQLKREEWMKKLLWMSGLLLFLCGCVSEEKVNDYSYVSTWAKEEWSAWHGKMVLKKPADAERAEKNLAVFVRGLELFAPYILEEYKVLDRELQLEPGTSLKRNIYGVDMTKTPVPHECTSWIIMPELVGGKQLILHKNRDSSSRYLTAIRGAVPGKYTWFGNGNFGTYAPTSGINEKALVVAMNSGARTKETGEYGLYTSLMARIFLENCATVDEAINMLGKMMEAGVYNHGKNTGSIWFFADRNGGCVVEQSAKHMYVDRLTSGLGVRGNHWTSAAMLPYSTSTPSEEMDNAIREYHVQDSLIQQSYNKNGIITMADIARTCRIKDYPKYNNLYPLCGKFTNVASTFVIDLEYPEELSYFSSTFGPPRHGIFIPVPLTLDNLPQEMRNGAWSNEAFVRKNANKEPDQDKLAAFEAELLTRHQQAMEKARKILQDSGDKAEAAAILKNAFEENFKAAKAFVFTYPEKAAAPEVEKSVLSHL
ncbi:MAG: linear amide C-N hydrolase [Lentisphaerae bacterium]|nr:linear amide C-N hydrolase [Lentisphaerota bacterium]